MEIIRPDLPDAHSDTGGVTAEVNFRQSGEPALNPGNGQVIYVQATEVPDLTPTRGAEQRDRAASTDELEPRTVSVVSMMQAIRRRDTFRRMDSRSRPLQPPPPGAVPPKAA